MALTDWAQMEMAKVKGTDLDEITQHLSSQMGPLGVLVAVIVWCYKTFAQLSHVTEQNAFVMRMIQEQRAELLAMRDQDRKDLMLYSDRNREKMEAVMGAIRDEVRGLREDLKSTYMNRNNRGN